MSRTKHSTELCLNHLPWTLVHQKTVLQSSVNWIRSHQRCVSQWSSTMKNMNVIFKAIRHKREYCVHNSKWLIALLANCGWLSTGLFRGKTPDICQTAVRYFGHEKYLRSRRDTVPWVQHKGRIGCHVWCQTTKERSFLLGHDDEQGVTETANNPIRDLMQRMKITWWKGTARQIMYLKR